MLVAVCLVACGKNPTSPDPAPAGSTTITIVSGASSLSTTAFSPNPITLAAGATVSFLNSDNTSHTSVANAGAWTSPNLAPGRRFNFTFMAAGSFPYRCSIHPNMVGTITVQ
jgi:plastocyanin